MDNIDETHPGAKEELEIKGLSVCRNTYNIGQSIDGAGEQTFMHNAKTTGGIKNFATQTNTYEKWVLSQPFAAQSVNGLRNDIGLDKTTNNPRKCLGEVEINKSEERVQKITYILENQFINPFSTNLERDKLYNLASGKPVRDEIADSLLTLEEHGSTMIDDFCKRISSDKDGKMLFFNPTTRAPWKGFVDTGCKAKLMRKNESKDIKVQQDILGLLAAKSQQQRASVNIDEALYYPLAPVPLSLTTCDGARRKTAKSKLSHVALSSMEITKNDLILNSTPENRL